MGIHGLMKLITEEAPESIKEVDLASLTGNLLPLTLYLPYAIFIQSIAHLRTEDRR